MIVKIFEAAGPKTESTSRDAPPTARVTSLRRTISRLGLQLLNKTSTAKTVADSRIIQNQRLSLESIKTTKQSLQARALPLEARFGGQALFHFEPIKLPSNEQSRTPAYTEILKPGHIAKLVLAKLYHTKNDVQIYIQKDPQTTEDLSQLIAKKIEQHEDEPFGLVLFRPPKHFLRKEEKTYADYEGHVTPVIVQKTSDGYDMINLDSAGQFNGQLQRVAQSERKVGQEVRQLLLQKPRQADLYSCHTDAVQVLKDALIEHQFHAGNMFDRYATKFADKASHFKEINGYLMDLPPFLQKTSQRSSALKVSSYSPESLSSTRVPSKNQDKSTTIAQHRDRFLAEIDDSHQINSFLLVKGYRNAFKVLEELEKLPTPKDRADYYQTLQTNHQLDI